MAADILFHFLIFFHLIINMFCLSSQFQTPLIFMRQSSLGLLGLYLFDISINSFKNMMVGSYFLVFIYFQEFYA